MKRLGNRSTNALVVLLLATMPFWMQYVGGYTELATQVLVMALAAMALNFLLGFTGTLSFGHAAYFGLGGYGVAMIIKYIAPSTPLGILVGVAVGTIAAMVIGALIIKLRGVYFAMVTIAFGQVFFFIAFRWNSVTGGDDGLTNWKRQALDFGFTRVELLDHALTFYYFVLVVLPARGGMHGTDPPLAVRAHAARDPRERARARFLGIPVERHLWLSFVISCAFCSLAGTLYALLNNFIDPRALYWGQSGNFVIMAVLGGMRSFWGPLVGAAIFVVLQDFVSSRTENWMSFVGLFFVLIVLFFPRGVLGMIRRRSSQ